MRQHEREDLLGELRALGRKLEGVMKLVDGKLPQAMKYSRAAFELGVGLTELKEMIRIGLIQTVVYAPGKHPKIPLSEIKRLTTVKPLPVEKPRVRSSRRKEQTPPASSSAATREALKRL